MNLDPRTARRSTLVIDPAASTDGSSSGESAALPPAGLFSDRWLVSLRWWFAALQAGAIAVAVWAFKLPLPWPPLLLCLGLGLASNLGLAWWVRKRTLGGGRGRELPAAAVAGILSLDVLLLMAMLACSGGAHNPFSVAALVQVTLAATLLPPRWTWGVVAVAILAYGVQFALEGFSGLLPWGGLLSNTTGVEAEPVGEPCPHCATSGTGLSLHLQGMWIAFVLAAGLVAHFVGRVSAALRAHGRALLVMGEAAARHRRLDALTTLAAGAAHELATPIGTIALVAEELAQAAQREGAPAEVLEDLRLLGSEAARCRVILDRMGGVVQGAPEEASVAVLPGVIGRLIEARLPPEQAARLRLDLAGAPPMLAPPEALVRALLVLVGNAFDASPADAEVHLTARALGQQVVLRVVDRGRGIEPALLARVGEPFVSTKPPGQGMGLGLFLAHGFAHGIGGSLTLHSTPGLGTEARLSVPTAPAGAT